AISTYERTQSSDTADIKRRIVRLYAYISKIYSSAALFDIDEMKMKAFKYLTQAERIAEELSEEDNSLSTVNMLAYLYEKLAASYGAFAVKDKQLEYCGKTLSAYRKANEIRHTLGTAENIADAHFNMGEAYLYFKYHGEYEKARDEYEKAASIYKTLLDEIDSDASRWNYVNAVCYAGKAYSESEKEADVAKALEYFEKGIEVFEKIKYPEKRTTANIKLFNFFGDALKKMGEKFSAAGDKQKYLDKAKKYYDMAEQLTEQEGKTEYARACNELLQLFENTDESLTGRIDTVIMAYFNTIALRNHQFVLNTKLSIAEQNFSEKTRALITMIYLNYWTNDKNERDKLRAIHEENQRKYDEEQARKNKS
ncbi:MAG: hypothetical protein IJ366_03820, partial [Clostridia bacterium]|nr:hypothetical protein [Clostridia bacterium]